MQHNMVIGNVASIRRLNDSNKVFITLADHYNGKDENGNYVQKVNYVPLEGFLPKGLEIVKGQLVAATFRVTQYKTRDNQYKTACDIVDIEVRLNNISKEKRNAAKNADTGANAPAADEELPGMETREDSEMPFGEAKPQEEEPAKKSGKKSAK